MALVDGPPAASLGALFRDRWRRATGESLPQPPAGASTAWPDGVEALLTDVKVGVSRASAVWKNYPETREARALSIASIAAARRCIYLENQYFTSPVVAEALALRLAEPDGPEVVLICTTQSPSWFDQLTMDRTRSDFIRRLESADRYGRFHIYSPSTSGGRVIIVHAKLAIIDDDFLRVGSANMNNRSTGFDTECELSFQANSEANRAAIDGLRTRLVAHWLGCPQAELDAALAREGSVGAAIEALRATGHNRLNPIKPRALGPLATFIAAFHIGDPLTPGDSLRLWRRRPRLAAEVAAVSAGDQQA
jgi:phosphatidylserine/phosphatidylglycerophosphate/cardiolipin synthase-like enzyme